MQCLYQQDILGKVAEAPEAGFWTRSKVDASTREFAELLLSRYRDQSERIDDLISEHLENWNLHRIAFVDRNILRMAVSELLSHQTPPAVVIDEALEVARKFSGNESREFINGVLDAIRKYLEEKDLERA